MTRGCLGQGNRTSTGSPSDVLTQHPPGCARVVLLYSHCWDGQHLVDLPSINLSNCFLNALNFRPFSHLVAVSPTVHVCSMWKHIFSWLFEAHSPWPSVYCDTTFWLCKMVNNPFPVCHHTVRYLVPFCHNLSELSHFQAKALVTPYIKSLWFW